MLCFLLLQGDKCLMCEAQRPMPSRARNSLAAREGWLCILQSQFGESTTNLDMLLSIMHAVYAEGTLSWKQGQGQPCRAISGQKHLRTSQIKKRTFLSAQPNSQSHKAVYYDEKYEARQFRMLDASHKEANQLHKAFNPVFGRTSVVEVRLNFSRAIF